MKEFITTNEFGDGCLQGYIAASYHRLIEVFGKPNVVTDGYKTDAEWKLKFNDDSIVSIYNYKDGKNYLGAEGENIINIVNWHIGGKNKKAVANIQRALRNATWLIWGLLNALRNKHWD